MFEYWKRNKKPTEPEGKRFITYRPLPRPEQDAWSYPWGYQTSYSNSMGKNCWAGNQLPGLTNYIPGVPESYATWYLHRNLQLTRNYQLSHGANGTVGTVGQKKSNDLAQQAGATWQKQRPQMPVYGFWQGGD
jgi:hypothetical protein